MKEIEDIVRATTIVFCDNAYALSQNTIVARDCSYIGILGPAQKRERMPADKQKEHLYLTPLQQQQSDYDTGMEMESAAP